jgi:hypothetical protein
VARPRRGAEVLEELRGRHPRHWLRSDAIKPEGSGVSYDSETQGFTKRYTHTVWGLGYIVTQEEMEDNLYEAVSKKRIKRLAFSARQTKENIVANVYNRAFNTSYTGGDAKALS